MDEDAVVNVKRKRSDSAGSTGDDDYANKVVALDDSINRETLTHHNTTDVDLPTTAISPGNVINAEEIQLDIDDDTCETNSSVFPDAIKPPANDESSECSVVIADTTEDSSAEPNSESIPIVDDDDAVIKDNLLFTINFRDADTFDVLNSALEQAIRSALLPFKKTVTVTAPSSFQLNVIENASDESEKCVFIIDSTARIGRPTTKNVPQYDVNVSNVFDEFSTARTVDDVNVEADACKRPAKMRASKRCFNCDGDHSIRDCTEPKNLLKIRQNRDQFTSNKPERYHVDAEQRFGQFIPGQISKTLRKALGLSRSELPTHVYRMRLLGYPPGWLEVSKVTESGLQLIVDSEKAAADGEAAEVVAVDENGTAAEEPPLYDLKKIISFPGFNVAPDANCFDMFMQYGVPPMQAYQSKTALVDFLRDNSVQSKKKSKQILDEPINDKPLAEIETCDMDIIDNAEEGELDDPPPPPPPPPLPLDANNSMESPKPSPPPGPPPSSVRKGSKSPSLDDLQAKQQLLLAALDDSTISTDGAAPATMDETQTTIDDSLIDDIMALDTTQSSMDNTSILDTTDIDANSTSNTSFGSPAPVLAQSSVVDEPNSPADTPPTTGTPTMNDSKRLEFGTPLLHSVSPFSKLPTGASWSEGVSDIIDFENLPESTGKYLQMKNVLSKVRDAVKQLKDEYD